MILEERLVTMISVVIPVFNTKTDFLKQCLDSVVCYQNLEIILINDGSVDTNTINMCKLYDDKFDNVKMISQKNAGPSVARNNGITNANGEYLIFLDSDDWWNHNIFENLEKTLNEYKPDILIFQAEKVEFTTGEKEFIGVSKKSIRHWDNGINALKEILTEDNFYEWYAWKYIIKKSLLETNELLFKKGIYYEDVDFIPRMFLCAKDIVEVPDVLVNYRFHNPTSILNTPNLKKSNDKLSVIDHFISYTISVNDKQLRSLLLKNISQLFLSAYGDYINGMNLNFKLVKKNFYLLSYSNMKFGKISYFVCRIFNIKIGSKIIRKILKKNKF